MSYGYVEIENNNQKKIPYVTVMLIVINVVVFLITDFSQRSEYLFNMGAMYSPVVFEWDQYYRLLTSMFLHWDYEHIFNNMIMLGLLGYQIEEDYGSIKYFITYMISGLMGNILSGVIEMISGQYSISAGASGAVFGIFGAMLVVMFKDRKRYGQNYGLRLTILFLIAVFGNMQEGVDWLAHLGGALSGVIMAFILYRPKNYR